MVKRKQIPDMFSRYRLATLSSNFVFAYDVEAVVIFMLVYLSRP